MHKYQEYQHYLDFIDNAATALNPATASKVDANANIETQSMPVIANEIYKTEAIKINRLAMQQKIAELYGNELAEQYIKDLENHFIYRHDETGLVGTPYCASITLYPFLLDGLRSMGGTSGPPHNLQSFTGGFINLVFAVAAQLLGACSTPEWLSYMDYFLRKDYGNDWHLNLEKIVDLSARKRTIKDVIYDTFQQVVYSLNQPAAARGSQAVFWNVAYFDKYYFEGLFHDFVFPDGDKMQWESVNVLQKLFMRWFNWERTKSVITFPVNLAA